MNHLLKSPGFLLETERNATLHQQLSQYCANAYQRFQRSWNQLCIDPYLRDGGRYRLRRYSVFHWYAQRLMALPHEPHYQSSHYNKLHGGFNRHFRAWLPHTIHNIAFQRIVKWSMREIGALPTERWRIQAHQFRIVVGREQYGKPTPEGIHKDGADYILIMLLDRQNIQGGESQILDNHKRLMSRHTFTQTGELLLINDAAVYHGVTPVKAVDSKQIGWRDVLVLTFHRQ